MPTTRSSTLPERSIGNLNKLPPEIRVEIYRHLLSTHYTAMSQEQEIAARRNETRPRRSYDLHPNVLRVSKCVKEEAARVLYDENLWVLVAFNQSASLDDPTGLHDHLRRRSPMGYISFPGWRAVKTPPRLALSIKIIDNPEGMNLYERFDKLLLPASQLRHFVAMLHSLMCSLHQDEWENFGARSTIEMSIGRLCHLNIKKSYDKLLKPFEGLFGFNRAKIRAQGKRDPKIRTLETELQKPAITIVGWLSAMFHLHQEIMMVRRQRPEVPQTLVRDYYLDLAEKMREPCEQAGFMEILLPGALLAIHQIRWRARVGLVRYEFDMRRCDKALRTMRWMQICNELDELRHMCENDIPMYHADARPSQAALSEFAEALEDHQEEDADHTLYTETDKRMI